MYRAIIAILIVGLWSPSFANTDIEMLWKEYSKAYMGKDCKTALNLLERLIRIDPEKAYIEKAFDHEKGRCLTINADKAIEAYQMVPKEKMDSMFALNLTHLLYMKAQSDQEKQQALSDVRDLLFDHIMLVSTAKELEKYVGMLFPKSPAFLLALRKEFDFFHSVDASPNLKVEQAEKLLKRGKFPSVAKYWLGQLTYKNTPKADYLFAKYFDGKLQENSGFLRYAAQNGLPEAQIAYADLQAKEGTQGGNRFAYFWYLKATQNGADVNVKIDQIKRKLSQSDISIIKGEALKEDSTYQ